MPATILDGTKVASDILNNLRYEVTTIKQMYQVTPTLATVLVGDNPASGVYVRRKIEKCGEMGMGSRHVQLSATATEADVASTLTGLTNDPAIHGILLQLPLPGNLPADRLLELIHPAKDVDGLHPYNLGRLFVGKPTMVPCTPAGVMALLDHYQIHLEGKTAVVVGRSNLVGKPLTMLLLQRNATVVCCHSRTRDLAVVCRRGEILLAAIGRVGLITGDFIRESAVVVDVGINSVSEEAEVKRVAGIDSSQYRTFQKKGYALVGDVEWTSVLPKAAAITPVPGGIGPLTIALLMKNTITACRQQMEQKAV